MEGQYSFHKNRIDAIKAALLAQQKIAKSYEKSPLTNFTGTVNFKIFNKRYDI